MGFTAGREQVNRFLENIMAEYEVYAPRRYAGGGAFSGTDSIRYGLVTDIGDVEFAVKSQYAFKEALLPPSQTLLYFTGDQIIEASAPEKKILVFIRTCDLHALKRLDDMYLYNGPPDHYYRQRRTDLKIALIPCRHSCENGFCADMGANVPDGYDFSIEPSEEGFLIDCAFAAWSQILADAGCEAREVIPAYPERNGVKVNVPEKLSLDIFRHDLWREYEGRCIACGRCNFVCPTCTCFTMQDMFYTDNGRAGERRRVAAGCMVDGFTDMAGGESYRNRNGDRMRFKVLHKISDHKQRFGHHMCVGCGRCDDICPEYISFSNCITKIDGAMRG